ncbi:MAG TPA: hypothetical protein VHO67_09815 [Polyangia bacterium]|nr:hypothetical protein [Polyangia bacterium]
MGSKPVKWVPAPTDALSVLSIHIKRRRLQGAKAEDVVFRYAVPPGRRARARTSEWKGWEGWHPKEIRVRWREVADAFGLPKELTFYGASRHSYTTKALTAGASVDEVSAALGHAAPTTTKRYYDHLVRRSFAPVLRMGLSEVRRAASAGSEDGGQS